MRNQSVIVIVIKAKISNMQIDKFTCLAARSKPKVSTSGHAESVHNVTRFVIHAATFVTTAGTKPTRYTLCTANTATTTKLRYSATIWSIHHPNTAIYCVKQSLPVSHIRLSAVGDRAFPVAAACNWNDLPCHITSASSSPVFRRRLKIHHFQRSFP